MPTIIFILVLFIGIPLSGQELQFQNDGEEWFWYDADSVRHTRAELDTIIAHHQIWLKKVYKFAMENKEEGEDSTEAMQRFWRGYSNYPVSILSEYNALRGDSLRANLGGTSLTGANLRRINFSGAYLREINLSGAHLIGTNLSGAYLRETNLSGAHLSGTNLSCAYLRGTNLSHAELKEANLTRTNLIGVNLAGADLWNADLTYAHLLGASLTDVLLGGADLTDALLRGADLTGVYLWGANLKNTIFEPDSLPSPQDIAYAKNLKWMSYADNPTPLVKLKNSLFEAGYIKASKKVNTALKRSDANELEKVLFDYTCEYGCNPWRPLGILVILIALFGVYYCFFPIFLKEYPKYIIASYKGQKKERVSYYWKKLSLGKKIQIAFLFSLQRALRLGFRELSPNHWLQMILPPEFEIKSRGWPRFVSGVQSIISVGLIVLTLLSYFSRPFESM